MKHSLFFAATCTPPDIPMKRRDLFKRTLLAAGAGLAGSSELFAQAPKLSTTYAGQLDMLKGQEGVGNSREAHAFGQAHTNDYIKRSAWQSLWGIGAHPPHECTYLTPMVDCASISKRSARRKIRRATGCLRQRNAISTSPCAITCPRLTSSNSATTRRR